MLINQARNLANLPYSSLQQLQQSIQRTQQAARPGAENASPTTSSRSIGRSRRPMRRRRRSQSDQALIANAQARWQNSVAGLQDALRVQATVVGNLDTNRTEMSALVTASYTGRGRRRCRRRRPAISSSRCRHSNSLTSRQLLPLQGRAQSLEAAPRVAAQDQAGSSSGASSRPIQGYQPSAVRMFHE